MLHLHGLERNERGAARHQIAYLNRHRNDAARHRRGEPTAAAAIVACSGQGIEHAQSPPAPFDQNRNGIALTHHWSGEPPIIQPDREAALFRARNGRGNRSA